MKKLLLIAMIILAVVAAPAIAQDAVRLPEPDKAGGATLAQALADRHSSRTFADVVLTPAQLSNLLWATAGKNRPDGHKVYPVAMNRQDMTAYAVTRDGVFRYDPDNHALIPIATGDHRAKTGKQPFTASAAVNIAFVQDLGLWREAPGEELGRQWGFTHAGAMTQNAYLYAATQGWSAVIRGMFDQEGLKKLLQLSPTQEVKLVLSVGP